MAAFVAEAINPAGKPATKALGPMTGRRYIDSLKDGREVWIDGERVADVTTHPAFKHMIAGVIVTGGKQLSTAAATATASICCAASTRRR
jgi:biotin carboxylase